MKKIFFGVVIMLMAISTIYPVSAATMAGKLKGKILLQVENHGEAWYVNPSNSQRYYLGRPADAFQIMRELGLGINEANYQKFNGQAPANLSGRILLRVEAHGEAYYVNPTDLKMYYLGRPADAFQIMRQLGLGITNENLNQIDISANSKRPLPSENGPEQKLVEMISAVDTCSAYQLTKQSITISDEMTLTMDLDNEILGEHNADKCNYRYKAKNVVVSVNEDQFQHALDSGKTAEEINKIVSDMQNYLDAFETSPDTYVRINKSELKQMLQNWLDQGYWKSDSSAESSIEIYNTWLEGHGAIGVSFTTPKYSIMMKDVSGENGQLTVILNDKEYILNVNDNAIVDGYEFVYLGTTPTTCTINGEDFSGADCPGRYNYAIKYKQREL